MRVILLKMCKNEATSLKVQKKYQPYSNIIDKHGPGTAKPALRGKLFKNHFLSVFCTTGPILPENIWKMVKNVFYVLSSTLYVHACFYTFTAIYNSWINQVRRTDYSSLASNESLFSSLQNGLYPQPADKSSSMSTIVFSFAGSSSDSSLSSETKFSSEASLPVSEDELLVSLQLSATRGTFAAGCKIYSSSLLLLSVEIEIEGTGGRPRQHRQWL